MVCLKNFTRPDKHREGKCLPRSHLLAPRNETKPEGGKSSDTLHRLRYSGPFCRCHTCLDYSKNIQTITVDVFGQTELPPPTKAQCFFFFPPKKLMSSDVARIRHSTAGRVFLWHGGSRPEAQHKHNPETKRPRPAAQDFANQETNRVGSQERVGWASTW